MRLLSLATLVAVTLITFPAFAAAQCLPWSRDAAQVETTLLVGAIDIQSDDVFDTQDDNESRGIHQLANRLHPTTRQYVIRQQLLFASGDDFDQSRLDETERNLRTNRFLRFASVTPVEICDGRVNIKVRTGDNWSLIPGFAFARAGGENRFAFKLSDINLLGFGKSIDMQLAFNAERDQQVLIYHDPLLLGTRKQLTMQLQNNTDGEVQLLDIKLPFFSLDSRRAWHVNAVNSEYMQQLYVAQQAVQNLNVERQRLGIEKGWSTGFRDGTVRRWRLGWQYDRKRLESNMASQQLDAIPEHTFSYPYIGYEWLVPKYIKKQNLQLMESVEDISTGHQLKSTVGFATTQTGSSENALMLDMEYRKGWQPNRSHLGLITADINARISSNGLHNAITRANLQWFVFQSAKRSLYFNSSVTLSYRLDAERQLLLGGDNGMRGFPLRYQSSTPQLPGNNSNRTARRVVFSAEQRYFFDWYPLRLARVGAAAFIDTGSLWQQHDKPVILGDVGVGLRIVSTRQADAKVMHVDIAVPLNSDESLERYQLVVSAKTRF